MDRYDERPWLRAYDPTVPVEIDPPQETYADLLRRAMTRRPAAPALYFMGRTLTFGVLDDLSARLAAFLRAKGCVPGDVVGIHLPNIPQYPITLAGVLRAGCAATGVSPLLTPPEVAYQLNDAGAKVLITLDALFEPRVAGVADQVPDLKYVLATGVGDWLPWPRRLAGKLLQKIPVGRVRPLPGKTVMPFAGALRAVAADATEPALTPEATCLLQYTGGTTGHPKGTILTHGNLVVNIRQILAWLDFKPEAEVVCSAFPFFHLAGLMVGMASLAQSVPQCLIPDPRNTEHICDQIERYRPTLLTNVPSLYQMLLETPRFRRLDFSTCKACISGAAPFATESIRAFEAVVGPGKVLEVYGMTEASPILTMNPFKGVKKIGSVGLPVPGTRIKLVDVETGTRAVGIDEEGELIANGPQVMKGYHNQPEETAHALRTFENEPWLYTGDVARMDADGYVTIVDRVKDMLIVGGYKVFSREVEEVLCRHPAVEACAVVGRPDPDRPGNDRVAAVIQTASEVAEIPATDLQAAVRAHCREHLAPYKVPKIVEFTSALPLTAVGKVDKKALR